MSSLAEIESAVDALSLAEKQELLLYLAARLRGQAESLPTPRRFSSEHIRAWIAEDEAELQRTKDSDPE
jgi:hypothetical protein